MRCCSCCNICTSAISGPCSDVMSDLQVDKLTKDCAEKASELERLKDELEKCENERLDLSEQLGVLSADKNIVDSDLKMSRKEATQHKKELEVFQSAFSLVVFTSPQ